MLQDLRHGVRSLRRAGSLPVVAVLTLAIGIGGVTAMFTVVNRVVLNPLPFKDQERLVLIWGSKPQDNQPELPFSRPDFDDLRAQARVFDAIGGWIPGRGNLTGSGDAEQIQWAVVTANLFDVLSVAPALGRPFHAREDQPGTTPTAVISHALWQRRFGADLAVVGRTLVLDQQTIEIVGVLPADFSFLTFPARTDVWLPIGADPFEGRRFARGVRAMGVLGRLRPATRLAQAQAEADTIAAGLSAAYPFFNTGRRFAVVPLGEQVAREVRGGAVILFGAVACVLFIACANVSSLTLARATSQNRDRLIRAALGASRWRLLRLQLAESALISAAGGVGGLLLAGWLVDLLVRLPYRSDSLYVPYAVARERIGIDLAALGFTMAVTFCSALLFSLAPAVRLRQQQHHDVLRAGARATADRPQRRLRAALVVAEVALALVLLVSAGLMVRSLTRLQRVDPGFAPDGVLSAQVTLSRSAYASPVRQSAFYTEALARLRALPGVAGVAAAEYLPFTGVDGSTGFLIDGRPAPGRADQQQVHYRGISPDYFEVMRIPLASGRHFNADDRSNRQKVAIINQTMARAYWPGENPVGRRLALDFETMRFFADRPPERDIAGGMREIVGVVHDIRHSSLQAQPGPEMYVPYTQRSVTDMTLVVRTSGDPLGLAAPVREVIRTIDPNQPVGQIETVASLVSSSIAQPRANAALLAAFAVVALALAMIGVFGLLAYDVAQRTPELGIRLALGGQPHDLRVLILRSGLTLVASGLLIGTPAAIATGTWLRRALFQVSPVDPVILVGAAGILVAVSLVACGIPARRATEVDPMVALRTE